MDFNAEVSAALAHCAAQRFEQIVLVLFGVDHDNVAAPSTDELIEPKVLEVTPIGKIDIPGAFVDKSEEFAY